MNSVRASAKAESRERIVGAAARRIRRSGVSGMGVAEVMADAGLTHGGFYAHFESKEALAHAAFGEAMRGRDSWMSELDELPRTERVERLLQRYLNARHRDCPDDGCPLPAVAPEAARRPSTQVVVAQELKLSLEKLTRALGPAPDARDEAIAMFSLCVGGLVLARAVGDDRLSAEILAATKRIGERAFAGTPPREEPS